MQNETWTAKIKLKTWMNADPHQITNCVFRWLSVTHTQRSQIEKAYILHMITPATFIVKTSSCHAAPVQAPFTHKLSMCAHTSSTSHCKSNFPQNQSWSTVLQACSSFGIAWHRSLERNGCLWIPSIWTTKVTSSKPIPKHTPKIPDTLSRWQASALGLSSAHRNAWMWH